MNDRDAEDILDSDKWTEWKRERIRAFSAAWRRKDIAELLSYITDDCIFQASVGPEPGTTYIGREEVRRVFQELIKHDEKGEAFGGRVLVEGNQAAAEWSFVFTGQDGKKIEVRGVDLFEFSGEKISRKDAFRKTYS